MDYWRLGLASLLSAACVLHTASAGGRRKEIAGPYVIVPRQIDECSVKGTNEFRIVSSKLLKIRRDVFSYSTDVIAPYGLSDQMTVGMRCAVYGNGGWKDNAYNFNFGGACQALKTLVPGAFEFIKRQFGSFNDCPIPPGNYTVRNATYKAQPFKAFPYIMYNKYRTEFYFEKEGKQIGCKRVYYDSIPTKNV